MELTDFRDFYTPDRKKFVVNITGRGYNIIDPTGNVYDAHDCRLKRKRGTPDGI